MDIHDFKLTPTDFGQFGRGLSRPECVWIDGEAVWTSDARGGLSRLSSNGDATLLGSGIGTPNGFSRREDGSFVVAGLDDGTVYTIDSDGTTAELLKDIDGVPIGAVNYPCVDGDRVWISVMTTDLPWDEGLRSPAKGRIVLLDDRCARVVADGLHLTNEVKVSPDGRYLYAAESLQRRIVRFAINPEGSLGSREVVGPDFLGEGAFPDGFTFDSEGNIWVTIICRNGLYVITPEGELHVVYEDVNEKALATLVAAVADGQATPELMGKCAAAGPLVLPTSVAFGGPDGRDVFVGSLATPHLATFTLGSGRPAGRIL